jgi:hypothetical protein
MQFVFVVSENRDTSNQWNESEIVTIIGIFSSEDKANEWLIKSEGRSKFGRLNRLENRWFGICKVPLNEVRPLTKDDDEKTSQHHA